MTRFFFIKMDNLILENLYLFTFLDYIKYFVVIKVNLINYQSPLSKVLSIKKSLEYNN